MPVGLGRGFFSPSRIEAYKTKSCLRARSSTALWWDLPHPSGGGLMLTGFVVHRLKALYVGD